MRFSTIDPIRDGSNWFAYVNNDPVNYVDLWGLELQWKKGEGATDEDIENARQMGETIASSDTIAGERWNELVKSDKTIVIEVNKKRYNDATPGNNEKLNPIEAIKSVIGIGGDVFVRFDPTDTTSLSDGTPSDPESTLAHEVAGHAYPMSVGTNPISRRKREQEATAIENEYRMFKGIPQRKSYGDWPVPQFYPQQNEGDNSNEKKNK